MLLRRVFCSRPLTMHRPACKRHMVQSSGSKWKLTVCPGTTPSCRLRCVTPRPFLLRGTSGCGQLRTQTFTSVSAFLTSSTISLSQAGHVPPTSVCARSSIRSRVRFSHTKPISDSWNLLQLQYGQGHGPLQPEMQFCPPIIAKSPLAAMSTLHVICRYTTSCAHKQKHRYPYRCTCVR
jgi:hypothetical protein